MAAAWPHRNRVPPVNQVVPRMGVVSPGECHCHFEAVEVPRRGMRGQIFCGLGSAANGEEILVTLFLYAHFIYLILLYVLWQPFLLFYNVSSLFLN